MIVQLLMHGIDEYFKYIVIREKDLPRVKAVAKKGQNECEDAQEDTFFHYCKKEGIELIDCAKKFEAGDDDKCIHDCKHLCEKDEFIPVYLDKED